MLRESERPARAQPFEPHQLKEAHVGKKPRQPHERNEKASKLTDSHRPQVRRDLRRSSLCHRHGRSQYPRDVSYQAWQEKTAKGRVSRFNPGPALSSNGPSRTHRPRTFHIFPCAIETCGLYSSQRATYTPANR